MGVGLCVGLDEVVARLEDAAGVELGGARIPRIPVPRPRLDDDAVPGAELALGALDLDHPVPRERLPGLGEVLVEVGVLPPRAGRERALELQVGTGSLGDLHPGPGLGARVALAD